MDGQVTNGELDVAVFYGKLMLRVDCTWRIGGASTCATSQDEKTLTQVLLLVTRDGD
jgi:hypothetical protein